MAAAEAPPLPGDLEGAVATEAATLQQVRDAAGLGSWLKARGVDTSQWGAGNTKSVDKLFKEVKYGEASVELFKTASGETKVLRSTHVLRGKVCSQRSYERNVFLFNTWQQFGDGRKRTRNGLLSEKLSTSEIPLKDHLHAVCKRAVEEEEMARLVESAFVLGPGNAAPEYDPKYRCPLTVITEHFVDYTIEVEESRSFPGLITAYHLYTVDIVCAGLPATDFNTLEFDEPDARGQRRLKYVHAWNWLNWQQIQRYLFEGSQLKASMRKGCFQGEDALRRWLEQYGMNLESWGKSGSKTVAELLQEVEKEEAQLELWSRHDGVPLLMRVLHVLQVKVISSDPRLTGKFLVQAWQQSQDGRAGSVNRLVSKKLSCSQVPFDEERFIQVAAQTLQNQLSYLSDVHLQINPASLPKKEDLVATQVNLTRLRFSEKHCDIQESPSFRGMHTMYHLYTMEVEIDGLPDADFSSVDFSRSKAHGPMVRGWRWMTLPVTLDLLHGQAQAMGRQEAKLHRCLADQRRELVDGAEKLARLSKALGGSGDVQAAKGELASLAEGFQSVADRVSQQEKDVARDTKGLVAEALPPAMLSKMAAETITSETFFEEALLKQSSDGSADVWGILSPKSDSRRKTRNTAALMQPLVSRGASFAMPWRLGAALALCAVQVALGSGLAARAKGTGGNVAFPLGAAVGGCGLGVLIVMEAFRPGGS